jgi:hypothetical protein
MMVHVFSDFTEDLPDRLHPAVLPSRRPLSRTVRRIPHRPTDYFGPRVRKVQDRPTDLWRSGVRRVRAGPPDRATDPGPGVRETW